MISDIISLPYKLKGNRENQVMIQKISILALTIIIAFSILPACSDVTNAPSHPALNGEAAIPAPGTHQLAGLWDVEVIPDGAGSAEVIFKPLRSSQVHLNVVGIMESGGGPAVGIIPPVTLADGILDVNIQLTHPFPDLDKFTGFDVRGILIGHGSIGGFSESMFYAGVNDMDLLNADGHTRLWNPTEYTGSGYIDGALGKPDSIANFTANLNGYKYFADDLTSDMPLGIMLTANRGAFTAGSSNVRHYRIRLGNQGLTFQYAVDANWWTPTEPIEVPGSFDVERANCPEPYHIDLFMSPGIHGDGGSSEMMVNIFDWQKDVEAVYVEAPLLTEDIIELGDPVDNGNFVTYSGTLTNTLLPLSEEVDVLVYARGTDPVSSTVYTDYHLYRLPVPRVPETGVTITIQDDMAYKTIGVEYEYGGRNYDYSNSDPAPVDYNDTSGPWFFASIPNEISATREAIDTGDPEVADFAGDFSSAVTHFFRTQGMIGGDTNELYQAEMHNESTNRLSLYGVYSNEELIEGVQALPLDPPINFQYPMDTSTHYLVEKTYVIIPILLNFTVSFEVWGLGEGVAFVPVDPGLYGWGWDTQAALLTRTVAYFETGGVMGMGPLGKALMYEWIADDGTFFGSVTSGNPEGVDPNFDDGTYEITGAAGATALRSIL
jgi:hypothetical protein